jgi:hypothetical protein
VLITVLKTVFVSVSTPLVAIHFSTSDQLVSSDLLFAMAVVVVGKERRRRERVAEEVGHDEQNKHSR